MLNGPQMKRNPPKHTAPDGLMQAFRAFFSAHRDAILGGDFVERRRDDWIFRAYRSVGAPGHCHVSFDRYRRPGTTRPSASGWFLYSLDDGGVEDMNVLEM